MYSHSFTYGYDNYTNTGINVAIQLNKNWTIQAGILDGTEVALWVPSSKDPGKQPSFEGCIRWVSDTAYDAIYVCADGINDGTWGYNNLQWYGFTYYHKFNERWHLSAEYWNIHQNNVLDVSQGYANTPWATFRNPPFEAHCNPGQTQCTAKEWSALAYLNYKVTPRDNTTWRVEFFDDQNGQRTGFKTRYFNNAIGWQHWFSPSVLIRPEIAYYTSLDADAFDNGKKDRLTVFAPDIIWKF
jgi:hypothetical protein